MSRAVLHPEANREFLRSARHYEKEVEGLGRDFIDCVEECRDRIVRNHGLKAQPHKAPAFSPGPTRDRQPVEVEALNSGAVSAEIHPVVLSAAAS